MVRTSVSGRKRLHVLRLLRLCLGTGVAISMLMAVVAVVSEVAWGGVVALINGLRRCCSLFSQGFRWGAVRRVVG